MTASLERWLPIPGYEGLYEVSDLGRVRWVRARKSIGTAAFRLKSPEIDQHGYLRLSLFRDGASKHHFVHHLVAEAFIGPRPSEEMHCCHSDGNSLNNTPQNLKWDSIYDNRADRVRHGTHNAGQQHPMAVLGDDQVIAIAKDPRSQRKIAVDYGVSQATVHLIKARKTWRHLWQSDHPTLVSQ